jgi:heme-degrading monooxygenase HmoA
LIVSVVKINAITVPEGRGHELEERFAHRAAAVENAPGFEGFELLRPVEGEGRYFVYTRWESEEAFQNWFQSQAFSEGHVQANRNRGGSAVGTAADLLAFEVVMSVGPKSAA